MNCLSGVALASALSLVAAFEASAASFRYDLEGAVFSDGATLSGSFVFDAMTGDYGNVDVTLSGASVDLSSTGQPYNGHYTVAEPLFVGTTLLTFARPGAGAGDAGVSLITGLPIETLDGGTAPIALVAYGSLISADLTESVDFEIRTSPPAAFIIGQPVPVPLPGGFLLLLAGLGGALTLRGTRHILAGSADRCSRAGG